MKQPLFKLAAPILALPRAAKRFVALSVDLGLCVVTVWLAFYLRLGEFVALSGTALWAVGASVGMCRLRHRERCSAEPCASTDRRRTHIVPPIGLPEPTPYCLRHKAARAVVLSYTGPATTTPTCRDDAWRP